MFKVTAPAQMNETFARAVNSRNLQAVLSLFEPDAALRIGDATLRGHQAISREFETLLALPGAMVSRNNFCIEHGDIALLRADWIIAHDGQVIARGNSAEIARRQPDGTWLYIVDHPAGAALPPVA